MERGFGLDILLVDDEIDILELITIELEFSGFGVTVAESGNEAIEMLKSKKFDAVISAFKMSNGDGVEILVFIKTLMARPLFIFISGQSDLTENECLMLGADKFIHKPFDTFHVACELRKILN